MSLPTLYGGAGEKAPQYMLGSDLTTATATLSSIRMRSDSHILKLPS